MPVLRPRPEGPLPSDLVSDWDSFAAAELERVMGGAPDLRHPRHGAPGGEWDALRALPPDVRRTLTGARLLTPGGELPDVAADVISLTVPGVDDVDAAVEWWADMCLAMIRHRRRVAHWVRHQRFAEGQGYTSYWYWRSRVTSR